ncbi:MAG: ScyD/ScyE family protein, partial [Acidimicrobiia bacterium]
SVPTSVAVGPDGYYYVGELTGFPGPTGESSIWRVHPNASSAQCGASPDCVKVFDGGFTSIVDLRFHKGRLYIAEMDEASWVAVEIFGGGVGGTINGCDVVSQKCRVIAEGIPMLTAITFDRRSKLWATQNSLIPNLAEVVRVR